MHSKALQLPPFYKGNPDTNFKNNSRENIDRNTCEIPTKIEKSADHDSIHVP